MYGIFMEYAWNMYGIGMDYAWNMHGIQWNMVGICMEAAPGSGSESASCHPGPRVRLFGMSLVCRFCVHMGTLTFCCLDAYSIGLNIHRACVEYWNRYGICMEY
jgi:hypothetical protein